MQRSTLIRSTTPPASAAFAPRFASLAGRVAEVLDSVARVDIRAYEEMPAAALLRTLRVEVLARMAEAQAVLELAEPPRGAAEPRPAASEVHATFELHIDSLMVSSSGAASIASDVAFVARLELAQRGRQLAALDETAGAGEILSQCDSSLRRIRKSLGALDHVLANLGGRLPSVPYDSELEISLRVRHAYRKLRRVVLAEADPQPHGLQRAMRSAGTAIAVLVGARIYPDLRVRDRIQLRALQTRILAWLRTEEPRDDLLGQRVFSDVVSFVRMLSLVSKRQELVAHDAALVERLLHHLGDGRSSDLASELRVLSGLDDELDALLESAAARPASALGPILRRLHGELGSGASW